jgi:hypothetical protein
MINSRSSSEAFEIKNSIANLLIFLNESKISELKIYTTRMWLNKSFRQKNPERSGTASSIPISLQLFISSIASFLSEGFFHAVESRNFTRAYFLGIKL